MLLLAKGFEERVIPRKKGGVSETYETRQRREYPGLLRGKKGAGRRSKNQDLHFYCWGGGKVYIVIGGL